MHSEEEMEIWNQELQDPCLRSDGVLLLYDVSRVCFDIMWCEVEE